MVKFDKKFALGVIPGVEGVISVIPLEGLLSKLLKLRMRNRNGDELEIEFDQAVEMNDLGQDLSAIVDFEPGDDTVCVTMTVEGFGLYTADVDEASMEPFIHNYLTDLVPEEPSKIRPYLDDYFKGR